MQIEKRAVVELKAAPYNPRKDLKPGDAEYEKLKRSIQEFGYVEPVIWNKRTGTVVGGHQRLKVMKDLGYEEVDCVVVDLDEQKEKALNIALNKISGEWDEGLLANLLKDLDNSGYDITFTGFDLAEAQELFGSGSFENVHEDEFDAESAAAEISEPKTKHGDLWLLGKHRLLCGDCTVAQDVAKLMDGRVADVMVTDPPYNVDYGSAIIGKNKSKTRTESTIANDNMNDDDFHQFLLAFYKAAYDVLKKGAPLYGFSQHEGDGELHAGDGRGGIQVCPDACVGEKSFHARSAGLSMDTRADFIRLERGRGTLLHRRQDAVDGFGGCCREYQEDEQGRTDRPCRANFGASYDRRERQQTCEVARSSDDETHHPVRKTHIQQQPRG